MKNMHLSVYLLRTLFSHILQPHADNPEDMSSGLSMLQRRDVVSVMQLPGHFLRMGAFYKKRPYYTECGEMIDGLFVIKSLVWYRI